jgi:hypothetical protein
VNNPFAFFTCPRNGFPSSGNIFKPENRNGTTGFTDEERAMVTKQVEESFTAKTPSSPS